MMSLPVISSLSLRFGRAAAFVLILGSAACSWPNYETLDVSAKAMAPVKTIAIATISARPSLSQALFSGNRGELVNMLGKFESELTDSLVAQGFNVININQSALHYGSKNMDYEIGYLHNTEDFMARARGEDEVLSEARRLRATSAVLTGNRLDRSPFLHPRDKVDQITSPNTRIFPEIGVNYRFNLPRYTENGGRHDNRFLSDAARLSIGEITRDMGADAYLMIDANLLLSARKEGIVLSGLTGGTRYVTIDGTAALIRNDGAIVNVDWLRNQSEIPVGGVNQKAFTPERDSGLPGFQTTPTAGGLQEGAYQAIRMAARDIAKRYADYRDEGLEAIRAAQKQ